MKMYSSGNWSCRDTEKSQWAGKVRETRRLELGPQRQGGVRRCILSAAVTNYHKHSDESNKFSSLSRSVG